MTTPPDLGAVVAIDVHVHVEGDGHGHYSMDDELLAASSAYFRTGAERAPTVEQIAALYREQQMMAVIFTVDATTAMGHPALSSEEIADRAATFADVLIPFGSVDPLLRGLPACSAWTADPGSSPPGGADYPHARPGRLIPGHPRRAARTTRMPGLDG